MKPLLKYIIFLLLPVMMLGVLSTSCEKEEETAVDSQNAAIHYIRSTDPAKSDSLIVGAFMGSLIAIVGDNLQDTKELWFNDQKATLNPTYITKKTILVNVPNTVPAQVTNKMRLVFGDGHELLYDFSVNVPAPSITSIKCEYVPTGGTALLQGDFFFEPIKVIFPGDVQGELVSVEKTQIAVTVPAGATSGPITIQTNFGKAKSGFYFRDNRNIILDYDTKLHETWTAPIAKPSDNPSPTPVDGGYAFFKHAADGAWMWTNELTMQYWAPRGRGKIPVATGNINDLVFKFEANVMEWKDVRMEIFLAPYAEDHGRDAPTTAMARWQPWKENGAYKTDGWVTVSIPLTEFKFGKDDPENEVNGSKKIENLANLSNVTMMLFGPAAGTNPVYIAFDNIRIVPK
ncbi:MAG: glycan-binding surface protein [Saprospiraceae bacterium]